MPDFSDKQGGVGVSVLDSERTQKLNENNPNAQGTLPSRNFSVNEIREQGRTEDIFRSPRYESGIASELSEDVKTANTHSRRSHHFIVTASSPEFAHEVAQAAEYYLHSHFKEWFGEKLPAWAENLRIPIEVFNRTDEEFRGQTTVIFKDGRVFDISQKVSGTNKEVIQSVLPHEIMHVANAIFYGNGIPIWIDEGVSSNVQDARSIRERQEALYEVFNPKNLRTIPFNKIIEMQNYPKDKLAIYAQGRSMAAMLVGLKGKIPFSHFVKDGLKTLNWEKTIRKHYGFKDMSDFQSSWINWFLAGEPDPRVSPVFNPNIRREDLKNKNPQFTNNTPRVGPSSEGWRSENGRDGNQNRAIESQWRSAKGQRGGTASDSEWRSVKDRSNEKNNPYQSAPKDGRWYAPIKDRDGNIIGWSLRKD